MSHNSNTSNTSSTSNNSNTSNTNSSSNSSSNKQSSSTASALYLLSATWPWSLGSPTQFCWVAWSTWEIMSTSGKHLWMWWTGSWLKRWRRWRTGSSVTRVEQTKRLSWRLGLASVSMVALGCPICPCVGHGGPWPWSRSFSSSSSVRMCPSPFLRSRNSCEDQPCLTGDGLVAGFAHQVTADAGAEVKAFNAYAEWCKEKAQDDWRRHEQRRHSRGCRVHVHVHWCQPEGCHLRR